MGRDFNHSCREYTIHFLKESRQVYWIDKYGDLLYLVCSVNTGTRVPWSLSAEQGSVDVSGGVGGVPGLDIAVVEIVTPESIVT